MRYRVELSERQLRLVMNALETYFRVSMGQFSDLADDIAFHDFNYDRKDDGFDKDFNDAIQRRDDALELFDMAFRTARGYKSFCKTDDEIDAIDIWHSIRYKFWEDRSEPKPHDTVESVFPRYHGHERPITIEGGKE